MKNFIRGMLSIFDLFPKTKIKYYTLPKWDEISDHDAIKKDWEAVGQDMWFAMGQFEKECLEKGISHDCFIRAIPGK